MAPKAQQFALSEIQARIKERLEDLGKSARGASLEAGLGASTIRNILEGRALNPRIDTLNAIAKALGMSPYWMLGTSIRNAENDPDSHLLEQGLAERGFDLDRGSIHLGKTIPLFVPLLADNSLLVLSRTFMTISRDAFSLMPSEKMFAIQIRDKSFEPAYYIEDILIFDPSLPVTPNNDYLFRQWTEEISPEFGESYHIIARLLSVNKDAYTVRFFASGKTVDLPRSKYVSATAVVGKAYRRR